MNPSSRKPSNETTSSPGSDASDISEVFHNRNWSLRTSNSESAGANARESQSALHSQESSSKQLAKQAFAVEQNRGSTKADSTPITHDEETNRREELDVSNGTSSPGSDARCIPEATNISSRSLMTSNSESISSPGTASIYGAAKVNASVRNSNNERGEIYSNAILAELPSKIGLHSKDRRDLLQGMSPLGSAASSISAAVNPISRKSSNGSISYPGTSASYVAADNQSSRKSNIGKTFVDSSVETRDSHTYVGYKGSGVNGVSGVATLNAMACPEEDISGKGSDRVEHPDETSEAMTRPEETISGQLIQSHSTFAERPNSTIRATSTTSNMPLCQPQDEEHFHSGPTAEHDGGCRSPVSHPDHSGSTAKQYEGCRSPIPHPEDDLRLSRQSSQAPTGPGWFKLTEKIYMYNKQPLKINTRVYRGKLSLAREWHDVAIKIIPHNDKNFNEVKLHLKLEDHPNIVRMLDADENQSGFTPFIYIVMEFCPNTLQDFIEGNKQKPFDFKQCFSYAKQIVSGVAYIHTYNILHRDIKLVNILISSSKDYIRVADFGLSKQLAEGHFVDTISHRGLGSDGYRAPEMHHEKPKASFHSDSFAIGVVLAMLFSNGQHPFGTDPFRWRTNIIDHKGLDLSTIIQFQKPYSQMRDQLLDLIHLALSLNPRDRPTPKEMLQHPFFCQLQEDSPKHPPCNEESPNPDAGINDAEPLDETSNARSRPDEAISSQKPHSGFSEKQNPTIQVNSSPLPASETDGGASASSNKQLWKRLDEARVTGKDREKNESAPHSLDAGLQQSTGRAFTIEPNQGCTEVRYEDADQSLNSNLESATSPVQANPIAAAVQPSHASATHQQDQVAVHFEDDDRSPIQSFEQAGRSKKVPVKRKPQARKERPGHATLLPGRTYALSAASVATNTKTYCNSCRSEIPSATDPDNRKWVYSINNQLFVNAEEKSVHIVFWVKNKNLSQYLSQYSDDKGFRQWPFSKPKLLKACPSDNVHYRFEITSNVYSLSGDDEICFKVSSFQHESQKQFDLHVDPFTHASASGPIILRYRVHTSTSHELEIHPRITDVRKSEDTRVTTTPMLSQPLDDTQDNPKDFMISNQLFIDEKTLCIECVFWRNEADFDNFTKGVKLPRKPFYLNVSATGTVCFRFTTKKDDPAYRINKEGEQKLCASYFKDHCYKIYSFRVDPGCAEFKCEDINVDYLVEDGLLSQDVPLRIKNWKKADRTFENSHNGGTNVTLNLSQGEWSNTIKNLVAGGVLKENNESCEAHFASGK